MRRLNYKDAKTVLLNTAVGEFNAIIVGSHGIGKTYMVQEIAQELNLNLGYWSASTMDPYIDLVGVPYPDKDTGRLRFAQRDDIFNMEFLFFDELNRAHLKVRNSILELIQFKRINGVKLPKLKMVWAAINPPTEEYQVDDLDPALRDRFHVHIELAPTPCVDFLKTKMKNETAEFIYNWWNQLGQDDKEKVTPRRLEYLGMCYDTGISVLDAAGDAIGKNALSLLDTYLKQSNNKAKIKGLDVGNPKIIKNKMNKIIQSVWEDAK
ncbi:hypothetical protein CMI47_12905 [Candidatus Pacearchaeota archaeon]|nr:hypothetical protein [Candidatus Pacearchaeota archaeon]|tara:strand:- start:96 stop:893 length:798 start_codon:yes stop_codon:yes gene_type:complete